MQTLLLNKLATVGTLTAGILHEINNPLTFVLTNLHFIDEQLKLLSQDYINQNSFMPKLSEIIGESIYGADRIKKIVSDLKGFVRTEINELSLVNINENIDKAVEIAYPQFKHCTNLVKEYTSDLPKILLTSGKLQQVFINLIINSAQAMDKNNVQNNLITIRTYLNKK